MLLAILLLFASIQVSLPPVPDRATLIAHRGESIEAPENSLEAFRRAFADGFGAELDLYLSLDGEVFLTHNYSIDTMRDSCGLAKLPTNCCWKGELDCAEAALNRGKAWKGTPFARLDDVLAIAPVDVRLYLDIKDPRREIFASIRRIVDRYPRLREENLVFLGKCDKTLFPKSPAYLCKLARTGWSKKAPPIPREEMLAALKAARVDGLDVRWDREVVTADYVKFFADAGYPVHVWTVNDPEEAAEAFARGVATVTTDSPRRLTTLWRAAFLPPPSTPEGAYRMMVFNIWGPFHDNPVAEREDGVVETVVRERPDVVAFQEVTPEWWKSALFRRLSDGYAVVEGGGERENRHRNPNPLLYRKDLFELVASGREMFHFRLDGSKGYTWALLRDKARGRRFTVFSTHFWWRENGPESEAIRLWNAEKLLAGLDRVRQIEPTPVVGGGDFNARTGSEALDYLFARGFADAWRVAKESSSETSWHGYPVRDWRRRLRGFLPRRDDGPGQSLDHVVVSAGVDVLRQRVVRHPAAMDVSDHSPVVVDFRLTDAAAD